MAENVSDLILHRLNKLDRELSGKLDDTARELTVIREELNDMREGQEEFLKNSVFAMGSAAGATYRVNELADEIDMLKTRLDKLEDNA